MFQFEFDKAQGILRVTIAGAWTLAEIERYRCEAGPQYAIARREAGALRLLIDNRKGALLQQNLVQPMIHAGRSNGRADDRIAMLVASSLIKIQTKRIYGEQYWGLFLSESAACTWLTAHDQIVDADL